MSFLWSGLQSIIKDHDSEFILFLHYLKKKFCHHGLIYMDILVHRVHFNISIRHVLCPISHLPYPPFCVFSLLLHQLNRYVDRWLLTLALPPHMFSASWLVGYFSWDSASPVLSHTWLSPWSIWDRSQWKHASLFCVSGSSYEVHPIHFLRGSPVSWVPVTHISHQLNYTPLDWLSPLLCHISHLSQTHASFLGITSPNKLPTHKTSSPSVF